MNAVIKGLLLLALMVAACPGATAAEDERGPSPALAHSPTQVFEAVAPAVVVISTPQSLGFAQGSGFLIRKDGVVATSLHVVAGYPEIRVKLRDQRVFAVDSVLGYDEDKDICLLKINGDDLAVVPIGDSDSMKPGEKVFVIGAPLGLEYSITDGLLSAVRELPGYKALQFTAPVSPGNSGGPLLNERGEAVGILTSVRLPAQNVNFAVAINELSVPLTASLAMDLREFSNKTRRLYSENGRQKDTGELAAGITPNVAGARPEQELSTKVAV